MLKPDIIPDKEPQIRVGIVLPEDKQKSIVLNIENCMNCNIIVDGKEVKKRGNKELTIEVINDKLLLQDNQCNNIIIEQKEGAYVVVKKVIAGRGFHWAKYIEVKLTGIIEIKNMDGNLILINQLSLEDYLACVATSEMSSACPDSYIEAQTIVARSWMLANVEQKHIHLGFDVCNDDCCQRFQGINNLTGFAQNAAKKTKGQVLIYDNKIVDARYSKSCGGIMEKFENLWENDPKPYMINKSDAPFEFEVNLVNENELKKWVSEVPESFCSPHYIKEEELHKYLGDVDEEGHYFRWTVETTQDELVANIKEKLGIDIVSVKNLIILKRAGSGRILELKIEYFDGNSISKSLIIYKDYEVRRVLHKMFLYSSAIYIEKIYEGKKTIPVKFVFKGAGWGHGAGMCQIGGIGMSLAGYTSKEIVAHYYPGSQVRKIYE